MSREDACLTKNKGMDLNSTPAMGKKLPTEGVVLKAFSDSLAVDGPRGYGGRVSRSIGEIAMAFGILEKVTRTERTLAYGCGDHVDCITMAAADHITHGRVTAASALVGERAMVGIAKGASMRADGVSCSRPFEGNGGGKAKTEGGFNMGGTEALGAALCQKGSTGVMENADMALSRNVSMGGFCEVVGDGVAKATGVSTDFVYGSGDIAEGNVDGGELRSQNRINGPVVVGKAEHPATLSCRVEHGRCEGRTDLAAISVNESVGLEPEEPWRGGDRESSKGG
ncbi:hypothetical protein WJX75_008565 [Coccomyxa subellipsoidea]|uniref:Uncharacterized protein n=1 Tax=Coccomyxa subellipsoidea TaxID=248742 RepID=A0ABR2YWC0_9CHLO